MQKIIITGAFGQLGRACLKVLKNNYSLLAVDRQIPTDYEGINYAMADITNPEVVKDLLSFEPEIILNLAALTNVDVCESNSEDAKIINTEAVKLLQHNFKGHFIQMSTDYVFNGKNGPYSEADKTDPISVYGHTKLAAEKWLNKNCRKLTIIRTNVVYSYGYSKASFVKWVIESLKDGIPIKVVIDQWNNPTWTCALAEIIEKVVNKKLYGLFNYGGAEIMNRYDFARKIAREFKLEESLISPITTAELNQTAPRPLKGGLKTEKLEKALEIRPLSVETCLHLIRLRMDS
ncbi:MAG: SDR family oxidoreductase [Candidatus Neomarinimicrobiota bacterium]